MNIPIGSIASAISKAIPLLDKNESRFEKLVLDYKIKKKIRILTIFPLLVFMTIALSYFFYSTFIGWSFILSFLPFFIFTFYVLVKHKKSKKNDINLFTLTLIFLLPIDTFLLYVIFSMIEGFKWEQIFFLVAALFFAYIFYYSLYHLVSTHISNILQNRYKDGFLEFRLTDNQNLYCRLITITKTGDFIVQVIDNKPFSGSEVFINKDQIVSIIYDHKSLL